MGLTAGVLTGISTAGSFLAQQRQAGAIDAQSDFEQKLAAMNATDAIARGQQQASRVGMQVRSTIGSQRAAYGAQGIALDSGSALDVQTDTASIGALDEQTIKNNAAREAYGITTNAMFDRIAAKQKSAAMRDASVDTLITGATKTYGLFSSNKNTTRKKT